MRAGLFPIPEFGLSIVGRGRRVGLFPIPDNKKVPLAGRRYGVYVVSLVLGPFPLPYFPNCCSPSFWGGYMGSCGLGVCACEDGVVGTRKKDEQYVI